MSYPCALCKKDYSSIKRLEKHKCCFCFLCQRSYSTKQKYDSHCCMRNNGREVWKVDVCGTSNHVCECCKKGFSSLNYLAAHKCPYCSVCDHIFASYQKYEMHKRKCARVNTTADIVLPESVPLPEPTGNATVVTDYKCELCKKYFSSPKYLATHKCAYCEPCKRSFATFQKYRMHRLKCTRTIESYENNPELGGEGEVFNGNVNSLDDVVAARGSFITRTVLSRMAMLELLRRRSALSSVSDLTISPGVNMEDDSDEDDRPEDLTFNKRDAVSPSDDVDTKDSQCLRGERTNYLLSRLSVSETSQAKSGGSSTTLHTDILRNNVAEEEILHLNSVSSPYFVRRNSDEGSDDIENMEDLGNSIDNRDERTQEHVPYSDVTDRLSPSDLPKSEQLINDDVEHSVKSLHADEQEHDSSGFNDRTSNQSPDTVERTNKQLHCGYQSVEFSRCDEGETRFSPRSDERLRRLSPHCDRKLPEEEFQGLSEVPLVLHPPPMVEPSVMTLDYNQSAAFNQRAIVARLMEAVRSRFLLSTGSYVSNQGVWNDAHDSDKFQTKDLISEMPRAKLIDSKPRGRMSAYAFFVQTCREEHKKKHPDENVVFSDFSRKCADRWKTMTDKEKHRFYEMAEKDKDRYETEMKGYRGPRTTRGSRKRRNRKDPNAPKRALSAFFWFCNDERPKVRALNPDVGVGFIAKQLGAAWGVTSPELKGKYEAMAESDKARYEREMKAFKEGNFSAKKQKTEEAAPEEMEEEDDDSETEEEEEDDDVE